MKKVIVVTGAAGFIGCNTVAALNARDIDDLLLVDSLGRDEKWRNLMALRFHDIIAPKSLLELLKSNRRRSIGAVIHLGALSSTTETDADLLLSNNYHYTKTLCQWCLQNDARFIYASTAATYGDGTFGFDDNDNVTAILQPLNMYGYSKHLFDLWALRSGALKHIAGLKYFNVFGPHENHKGEMRSVVCKMREQIQRNDEVLLFKSYDPQIPDGEQRRDFIYVEDAVAVTLHFLDHRERSGLFNCGTGKSHSWNDLAATVFTALNRSPRIRYIDMPPDVRGKYQYFTEAKTEKLRRAGYVKNFMPLEDGVRKYVSRYLCGSGSKATEL